MAKARVDAEEQRARVAVPAAVSANCQLRESSQQHVVFLLYTAKALKRRQRLLFLGRRPLPLNLSDPCHA
jgi:hypothetical protein